MPPLPDAASDALDPGLNWFSVDLSMPPEDVVVVVGIVAAEKGDQSLLFEAMLDRCRRCVVDKAERWTRGIVAEMDVAEAVILYPTLGPPKPTAPFKLR